MTAKRQPDGSYLYNGWRIEGEGGFITLRRFVASKGELSVWGERLKDILPRCDALDHGEPVGELYLRSLYN